MLVRQPFESSLPIAAIVAAALVSGSVWAGPREAPQFYSGYIEDNGIPFDGTASITLRIWSDGVSTDVADLVCTSADSTTPVVAGRFSIALDPTCQDMGEQEELHLEVEVDTDVLPRVQVGKLPYAAAAAVAHEATGALAQQLSDVATVAANASTQATNALTFDDLTFALFDTAFDLNTGTTIDGAFIQRALQTGCAAGTVLRDFDVEGNSVCEPIPPDLIGTAGVLAEGTQVGTPAGPRLLQGALDSSCPAGTVLRDFAPDGSSICEGLPPDVVATAATLAEGTQVGTPAGPRLLQGALDSSCPAGTVLRDFAPDGSSICEGLPPDLVATAATLAEGTQVGTPAGPRLLQGALDSSCPAGTVLRDFAPDGSSICEGLPPDLVATAATLAEGTQVGTPSGPRLLQGALDSSCPAGTVLRDFAPDGSSICEGLPPDVVATAVTLAQGTQVDTFGGPRAVQAALDTGCSPGNVLADILADGSSACEPLPLDFATEVGTLAQGTQIETGAGPFLVQAALAAQCPAGQVLSVINADGTRFCEPLPLDVSAAAVDLQNGSTVDGAEIQRALAVACPAGEFLFDVDVDGTPHCASPRGPDIVTVGPVHANFPDVQTAMTAIGFPVVPVVVEVQPGVYPGFLGHPNVYVVGSGVGVTIFEDVTSPVIEIDGGGLSHATVRYTDVAPVTGVAAKNAAHFEHVFVDVNPLLTGSGACQGIAAQGPATIDLNHVGVSVFGGPCTSADGVVGDPGGNATFMNFDQLEVFSEDSAIVVNGGNLTCIGCVLNAAGTVTPVVDLGGAVARLFRSRVTAQGGTGFAIGLDLNNVADDVEIEGTQVEGFGSTGGFGISATAGRLRVTHSRLSGSTQGMDFDVGCDGTFLWSETSGVFGDTPQTCLYGVDETGVNPCG